MRSVCQASAARRCADGETPPCLRGPEYRPPDERMNIMKQELVKLSCPQCGKEFYRTPSYLRQYGKYKPCCSPACKGAYFKAHKSANKIREERPRAANGEIRLPHTWVKIRVTKQVEIYPELRPEVGQTYPAEKYRPPTSVKKPGYVIQSGGKRINIRADECVEV